MYIFIEMPSGIKILLDAEPTERLENIKVKIQEIAGTPPERQQLYFDGQALRGNITLADYGIRNESTLTLSNISDISSLHYFDYTVQSGDSLWLLAQRFSTTVDAIKSLNGLTTDRIYIGQMLKIPLEIENPLPSPGYFNYTVRSGDSLWLIANLFGTTVNAIKALNNLTDDMIFVGKMLKIPDEFANLPPPLPIVRPTLRIGDTGLHVAVLQAQLHFWLFMPGPMDGIFGPLTQRAVMAFQRDRVLVADGIVGPLTWAALFDYSSIGWNHTG